MGNCDPVIVRCPVTPNLNSPEFKSILQSYCAYNGKNGSRFASESVENLLSLRRLQILAGGHHHV